MAAASSFTALFAGDLGFGEHYMHHPRAEVLQRLLTREGHNASLEALTPLIRAADVAIGNLEAPLAARPDPALSWRKSGLTWSDPEPAVAALGAAGFTALSLANDHALDCGRSGLDATRRLLAEAGIHAFGAGPDPDIAGQPYLTAFKSDGRDRTLVVFGMFEYRELYHRRFHWYSSHGLPGVNPMSPKRLKHAIDGLRQVLPAPVFVAFAHWGESYAPTSDAQRAAARQLVTAGTDVVIGHGSHVAQSFERIGGRPVLFGLGNCVWNTPGRYGIDQVAPYSLLATLQFPDAGPAALRLTPILTDNMVTGYRNRPLTGAEFDDFAALYAGDWKRGETQGVASLETRLFLPPAPPRPEPASDSRFRKLFDILRED